MFPKSAIILFNLSVTSLLLSPALAFADNGLVEKLKSSETLTRTVKTVNGAGPVIGHFEQDFTETTGTKFSLTNSSESNRTIINATQVKANISAAIDGVTGGVDAGMEETETLYTSTVRSLTNEIDHTNTKVRHYVLENGMEGYLGVVTDSVGGFSNSYYTQDKTVRPYSKTANVVLTVDYTPTFKRYLAIILITRRKAKDNGSAWDHLYNAANTASQDANTPFLTYCNAMAGFSDGMDSGSWAILSASAANARTLYQANRPKEAMLEFLQGFQLVRSPSKNRSEWSGLAGQAEAMITTIRGIQ